MKGKGFFKELYKNRALYSMFLPAAAVLILFNYLPMFGMVTAFKDFNFADGISVFVGIGDKGHMEYDLAKSVIYRIRTGIRTGICIDV